MQTYTPNYSSTFVRDVARTLVDVMALPTRKGRVLNIPGHYRNFSQLGRALHNIESEMIEPIIVDDGVLLRRAGTDYTTLVRGRRSSTGFYYAFDVVNPIWKPSDDMFARAGDGSLLTNTHPTVRNAERYARKAEIPAWQLYSKHVFIAAGAKNLKLHFVTDEMTEKEAFNAIVRGYRLEKRYRKNNS